MTKETFFIGIDSGGTKAELSIKDNKERIIYNNTFKARHYSIYGLEKVANFLKDIIENSLNKKKLDIKNCKGICIGLAGVREKKDKRELKKRMINLLGFENIIIESDSMIALYGAFGKKDGLMLICGTGSILIGRINNEFIRIGGWGWRIGDYGSGTEIGRNAIKQLVKEYDSKKNLSELSKAIEKEFSINRKNILKQVYQNNFEFQKIVPLVLMYAERRDKDAKRIIEKAVEELLLHFKIFYIKTKYYRRVGVAFSGSIIEGDNILSKSLKREIKRNYKSLEIIDKINKPTEGAIILAKNKFNKKVEKI